MARLPWLLVVLAALVALASASSAPTFCKCTCFTNSTIIKMGPPSSGGSPDGGSDSSNNNNNDSNSPSLARRLYSAQSNHRQRDMPSSSSPRSSSLVTRANSPSCSQCNRAFCLEYNLPICKGAEEKDVMTMCFQRDSRKDEIIVWGFILGTTGLLGWAAAKRGMEAREARAAERSRDPLLPGGGNAGSADSPAGPIGFMNGLLARIGITGRDAGAGGSVGGAPQYAPLGRT